MMSFDHRIQGTQIEVQTKKVPVGTTHNGLKTKIEEVRDDFSLGRDLT
jgi:hypothetical protein